jgi:diguanylate cyclase (GGDEF)-like protein
MVWINLILQRCEMRAPKKMTADKIKELEAQLASAIEAREKIDLLTELAGELIESDPKRARLLGEQAYELATTGEFSQQPYLPGIPASLRILNYLNCIAGQYPLVISQSLQALAILEITPNPAIKIDIFCDMAWAFQGLGSYPEGLDYGFQALKIAQELGNRRVEANVLNIIATVYYESKKPSQAIEMCQKGLRLYRELKDITGEASSLNILALPCLAIGVHSEALDYALQGLQLAQEQGIDELVSATQETIGQIYLAMHDFGNARRYFQLVLTTQEQAGIQGKSWQREMEALTGLGRVSVFEQDYAAAVASFQQALQIAEEINAQSKQADIHELLSGAYEQQGDFSSALAHYKQFHRLKEVVFSEDSAVKFANLQAAHEAENAKKDAEIFHLKNIELQNEIDERKKVQAILEELATTDALTGLLNRRQFYLLAGSVIEQAGKYSHPLTVVLFDIDHFKKINDTYGHSAGDRVLVELADIVRTHVRHWEIVCRYGGEEFAILLPGTTLDQGVQFAKRLGEKIAEQRLDIHGEQIGITVSLGVADLSREAPTIDALLEHADRAMYHAKRAGRNCVRAYSSMA